jgi:hypothetical protein
MPGQAGNFLTRLFSLSPDTIPQAPIDALKNSVINTGKPPTIDNRAEYYSFEQVFNKFNTWQDFHRAWPDFYQHELFYHFNRLYPEPFSHVVYAIHPHEFGLMEDGIVQPDADYYYVDLDKKYEPWVLKQQASLNFQYRPNYQSELNLFNQIKTKYSMTPINLTTMLDSTDTFVDEYLKISQTMQLTADVDSAKTLYSGWFKQRGPNGNYY